MWEVIKDWIFSVIQFFYDFCGDWGLAIIIITLIFRIILIPLMHSQAKSNFQMQKIQPEIKKIQQRYADDQPRQSQELQKIYAEAKYNPVAGCVPMLLQMPIFIALFQVLREMGDRITDATSVSFYNIVPSLTMTPGQSLTEAMGGAGWGTFVPYIILMLIFAGATFLPMLLQQKTNSDPQQRQQMTIMASVMMIMMLWISWSSPAGVLLFWGVSSLLGVAQNQISTRMFKKADEKAAAEAELEIKPVEIHVTRKAKKKRPTKKR